MNQICKRYNLFKAWYVYMYYVHILVCSIIYVSSVVYNTEVSWQVYLNQHCMLFSVLWQVVKIFKISHKSVPFHTYYHYFNLESEDWKVSNGKQERI